MNGRLLIDMLGAPAITLDGAPVRGFVSSKAAALVYYLAATGRPHTREALGGLLWGEASDAQAHKNLRDVLSNLRRLLGPVLTISRQTVSLDLDADRDVDSRRFEVLLQQAEHLPAGESLPLLQRALEIYRGDFLSGFSLSRAVEYEEWALVERERLRQLAMNGLHSLAARAAEAGAYQEGVAAATRLLALDPTREEGHRQLMLLLSLRGQRGAALAQYEVCRRVLNDELGIDPDQATEALYRQILDGELQSTPSAIAAPAYVRSHYYLPAPLTGLIGRAAELRQVVEQLRSPSCRLLTITGAGGVGKTRLALAAARQLLPASQAGEVFAHGIAFVALAPIEAAGSDQSIFPALAARTADALGFSFSGPDLPHVQLAHYLREKELLLVLDNCEHLPVASFTLNLLEQAPGLTVLATSRGRLQLPGEQIVALDGLSFPQIEPAASDMAAADFESYGAIQLFQYHAESVNPRSERTPENLQAAARVCALVAGLPLGIELAASLVRLMPCQEIASELERSLEFLQSSRRDLPERHWSLRAIFDHSWRLLQPAEQRALAQLSVFRGGFSRDAASKVAGASLGVLASLVDNSLVRRTADRGQARYELLELVRQYAGEKLPAASPIADRDSELSAVLDRHCRYYLGLLHQRRSDLRGLRQQEALGEIGLELENIRAAWRAAVAAGDIGLIDQATEGLFFLYEMRSWFSEGAEELALAAMRLAELHEHAPTQQIKLVWGRLLGRQGWCVFQTGRPGQARALLEQSLAILRSLAAPAEIVFALNYLASVAYHSGDYEQAHQLAEQGLSFSMECGDQLATAVSKTVLGQIAYLVGRYEDARRYSRESLAIERGLGNRWGMAFTLMSLGRVDQALGAYEEARRSFREALAIREAFGDTRGIALCLNYLGDTAQSSADYAEARRCYEQSLARFKELGNRADTATSLTKLGYNALALGECQAASMHFYDALRSAWDAQAIPPSLEAIAGIAATQAERAPELACELASLVQHHPAAIQQSRDRAAAILAATPATAGQVRALAAVVAALLETV